MSDPRCNKASEDGCTCQQCGEKYKVDIIVPDNIWSKIQPRNSEPSAGLLCGSCIAKKLEAWGFSAYDLAPVNSRLEAGREGE